MFLSTIFRVKFVSRGHLFYVTSSVVRANRHSCSFTFAQVKYFVCSLPRALATDRLAPAVPRQEVRLMTERVFE